MTQGPVESSNIGGAQSSTGLDPKLGGLLSYLLGFITGVIFLVIEKEDRFVRFHAYQSVATFVGLLVLSVVAGFIPVIGWITGFLLGPATFVLWLFLMVKAFQGEEFRIPVVGDWAAEQAGKSH